MNLVKLLSTSALVSYFILNVSINASMGKYKLKESKKKANKSVVKTRIKGIEENKNKSVL